MLKNLQFNTALKQNLSKQSVQYTYTKTYTKAKGETMKERKTNKTTRKVQIKTWEGCLQGDKPLSGRSKLLCYYLTFFLIIFIFLEWFF